MEDEKILKFIEETTNLALKHDLTKVETIDAVIYVLAATIKTFPKDIQAIGVVDIYRRLIRILDLL
jgi:hypothetical protein